MTMNQKFICALFSARHDENNRTQLRKCIAVERDRKSNEASRFHTLPEKEEKFDLRMIPAS